MEIMNKLMTNADIAEVTGYKSQAKQCEALSDHGVSFMTDRNGFPKTTWYNFNHPTHLRRFVAADNDTPDFSSME